MYLWIGLGIEEKEENKIRTYCKKVNKAKVNEQSFTLPQHISLKTSFKTESYLEIIDYIKNKYNELEEISLNVHKIGNIPGVIWLEIKENAILRNIHNELNNELNRKFQIQLNGFDGEKFKFHSTLFQDVDNKKMINDLYDKIKDIKFYDDKFNATKIYFGISEVGKVGTYKVIDCLELKNKE